MRGTAKQRRRQDDTDASIVREILSKRIEPPIESEEVYGYAYPGGNVRIGSTDQSHIRGGYHKSKGGRKIFSFMFKNREERYRTERAMSRFYANQATEEEFEVVNTDY